jgi:hypothetical protein
MIVTDQRTSDSSPYTLAGETATGWGSSGLKMVWMV